MYVTPQPFEIESKDGTTVATDGGIIVVTNCDDAVVRKRRAVKMNGGELNNVEIVYIEVEGVRTYVQKLINGNVTVLVTREDIYP